MNTSSLIDYEGLIRGDGEWKNMQEVICRTFRVLVDQNNQNAETIKKMQTQIHQVKDELNQRPSWEDVERLVETKILNDKKKNSKISNEIDQLKIQFAHMKGDLEKKASINYLEMSLKKKMDRSEGILRNPASTSSPSTKPVVTNLSAVNDEDIKKMKFETLQMKVDLDNLTHIVESSVKSYDIPRVCSDVAIMKSQLEHLTSSFHKDNLSKDEINILLNQKANRSDVEVQLSSKADQIVMNQVRHFLRPFVLLCNSLFLDRMFVV
jgi:hypothetical protein